MPNEDVYEAMSGTEVGRKLEKMMDLMDEAMVDASKYISDIQRMTENYEEYLHEYGKGGDWEIKEFMASITKKTKAVNDILGIENDDK